MLREPIRSVVAVLHDLRNGKICNLNADTIGGLIRDLEELPIAVENVESQPIDEHDDRPISQRRLDMGHVFKEDHRKDNAGLHMLYTTTAVEHLRLIDSTLRRMWDTSNLCMHDLIAAVQFERNKLIETNAAYAQADVILHSLKLTASTYIVDASSGETIG